MATGYEKGRNIMATVYPWIDLPDYVRYQLHALIWKSISMKYAFQNIDYEKVYSRWKYEKKLG